jgi:hypothetical protein
VETGANVQLPTSACLRVEEQTLPSTFVLEQLMFWFHQPRRKNDVVCLGGAGELPCPTNVLRCCIGAGISPEELQRHQELLSGITAPPCSRRFRLHQFAATLSKAFIGCSALCISMKELEQADVYKDSAVLCLPNDLASVCTTLASSAAQPDVHHSWYEAEDIIAERQQPCNQSSKKRKRQVTVTMYLVRWRGKPCPADSWEPKSNINAELLAQWVNSRGDSVAGAASPTPAAMDGAPAALVSMFQYRSQDVGHCVEVLLYGSVHGHIYGDYLYTDDSDVATAALHAGALELGETKLIKVYITGPQQTFKKSLRNGIQSHRYTHFPGSFTFEEDVALGVRRSKEKRKSSKKVCVQHSEQEAAVANPAADDELVLL